MGKKENCLYLQVAHCNKCGGESGYNIYDGEKVCFDCGEPYKADFSVSKVESTITTTNTQPQAEEKPVTVAYMGEEVVAGTDKSIKKHKKDMEDFIKGKSTPEEKEEWEEELGKLMSTWGKVLFVNKGRIGAGMQTAMYLKFYHFIKDLLLEREREVLNSMREWVVEYHKDNWDIRDFDAEIAIGKIIDRELSKLNK